MLSRVRNRQSGATLVELMAGILVSLILLAGVVTLIVRVSVTGGESVQSTRLNQQMRGTLDQMSKELQRAGYVNWYNAWDSNDCDGSSNDVLEDANGDGEVDVLDFYECAVPAINTFGAVRTANLDNSDCDSGCACILYSYDIDEDAQLSADEFERFGMRLNNGAVETRTAGDDHACDTGQWEPITDESITVTNLDFSLVYADAVGAGGSYNDSTVYRFLSGETAPDDSPYLNTACTPGLGNIDDDKCLWRRKVDITIEAELADDEAVSMVLDTGVRIRNDYFNTQ